MHCLLLAKQSVALVDVMHGRGPSDKLHTQLQPTKKCIF